MGEAAKYEVNLISLDFDSASWYGKATAVQNIEIDVRRTTAARGGA